MDLVLSHDWPIDGVIVITLDGGVDEYTASQLRDYIMEATDGVSVRHVIFDVRELGFIESTGLGTLVGALNRFRKQPQPAPVTIAGTNEMLDKQFAITGLRRVFRTSPTVAAALDDIRSPKKEQ